MKTVSSGFNSNVDNCARFQTIVRFRARLDVEFLNGIDWQMGCGSSFDAFCIDYSRTVVGIIVIHAIDHEVVVFRAITVGVDGEKTTAWATLDSRLQNHKVLEVAAQQWEFRNGFVRERT